MLPAPVSPAWAETAFQVVNTLVLPGWMILFFAPRWKFGAWLVSGVIIPGVLAVAYLGLARDALIQNFPEGFATPGSVLSAMQDLAEYGLGRDEWTTYLDRVAKISDDSVKQVLSEIVDRNQQLIVIAGDRKSLEPQLQAAGFTKIVVVPLKELTDVIKPAELEPGASK